MARHLEETDIPIEYKKTKRDNFLKSRNIFRNGGSNTNRDYKSANIWNIANINKILRPITEPLSKTLMNIGRSNVFDGDFSPNSELDYGTPQDTYLLPKNVQKDIFLEKGYIEAPKDYGLVRKAVGNRNIPVYQRKPDDISRDKVFPIGNISTIWRGKKEAALENPGSYPTAVYYSPETNKYYQKAWDLNDYGGGGGAYNNMYSPIERLKSDIIDKVGSPVVTTTGISEIGNAEKLINDPATYSLIKNFFNTKGLVLTDISDKPLTNNQKFILKSGFDPYLFDTNKDRKIIPTLPEITITGKNKRKKLGISH